jgi:hypothetical protein
LWRASWPARPGATLQAATGRAEPDKLSASGTATSAKPDEPSPRLATSCLFFSLCRSRREVKPAARTESCHALAARALVQCNWIGQEPQAHGATLCQTSDLCCLAASRCQRKLIRRNFILQTLILRRSIGFAPEKSRFDRPCGPRTAQKSKSIIHLSVKLVCVCLHNNACWAMEPNRLCCVAT